MSVLDKVKDIVGKDVEQDIEKKINEVTQLVTSNQDFATEFFNFVKMPDLNVEDTVNKLFAEVKDNEFVKKIQKEVTKFLLKNPKLMKDVLKLVAKFK